MDKNGVIIVGGNVQGLGLLRTYGQYNIKTILINNRPLDIVKFSKYLKNYVFFKKMSDPIELKNFLINLAKDKKLEGWIILPTEDSVVYTLSKYKVELEQYYKIPTPAWDTIKYTYDKKLTYMLAEKIGIPIPKTFYPKDISEVMNISEKIDFPCLLKPSVMHRFYNLTGKKLLKVNTKDEMLKSYHTMTQFIPPSEVIVQEVIGGKQKIPISFGCFLMKDMISWVMIAKKRMIPVDFGVGTYNETTDVPQLKDLSLKILNEIGYSGLCEVEFIKDLKDQTYKFLEINPRSWLQITITNKTSKPLIPLLYYYYQNQRDKLNSILFDNTEEIHQVKWIHFWQDLYVSLFGILRGTLNSNEYLKSFKGKIEFAVASWDDPLPFIFEPWLYCISSIKKMLKNRALY